MNKPDNIVDAFPATPLQLGMLYHAMVAPDSAVFLQHYSMYVDGDLDAEAFAAAWQEVTARHAALRSSFHWQGLDQCLQVVSRAATLPVRHEDWSAEVPEGLEDRLRELVWEDRRVPFDLERPPLSRLTLVKLSDSRHLMVIAFHHLITDGWSLNVAMDEVAAIYAEKTLGRPARLPPAPSFKAYATWLRQVDPTEARSFWRAHLDGAQPCRLPLRKLLGEEKDTPESLATRDLRVGVEDTNLMLQAARRMGVTSAILVQAAWALLLGRYERQERVLFAIASANRPAAVADIDRIFGPLMAVLPCNLEIENSQSVQAWLSALQQEQLRARELDFLSPAEHQQIAGFSPLDEFLSSMLVVEDMPAAQSPVWSEQGLEFAYFEAYDRTAYPLNMFAFPGESYLFRLGFDRRQFSAEAADHILSQMHGLCRQLAEDPDRPVASIELAEGDAASSCFSGGEALGQSGCLWSCLSGSLSGLGVALEGEDGSGLASGPELLARAGDFDAALTSGGHAPGAPVALLLDPGVDYACAILACLRRGSPYALLDPLLPAPALGERLASAGIGALVAARERLAALLAELPSDLEVLGIAPEDLEGRASEVPAPRPGEGAAAAVAMVWTSGSTGTPKAPVLTQGAVLNRLHWDRESFAREGSPKGLLKTSPAFVDSVAEILQPLFDGYPAVVPDADAARAPSALLGLMRDCGVSRLVLTPSVLRAVLDVEAEAGVGAGLWPLKRLHVSGEPLPADLLPRLAERLSADCVVLNIYGSAEVTADVTAARLALSAAPGRVPIGAPLPGCEIWLLDGRRRPVAPGAVGEMHVAGVGLAQGYHGAPELSARRFFAWTAPDGRELRLYATGDLARRGAEGDLVVLGRKDGQIKLRGVRIEPGEIEARLLDLPEVRAAVVSAVRPEPGSEARRLVAYLEPAATVPDENRRADHWQRIYDQSYQDVSAGGDVLEDFRIWRSAIDGAPIPASEMQAWVQANLDLVRERAGRSLVEIGCGQGLLLGRLGADFESYLGTDISAEALVCVRQLQARRAGLEHVRCLQLAADQRLPDELCPEGGFDVALLSSVVQYLPSADYLLRSLEVLLPRMAEGGRILVTDLRSLPLAPLLATEILLHRAEAGLDRPALQRRLQQQQAQEPELLVDPRYFLTLKGRLPRLAGIEARPKPGRADNELNSYRYDVVLHLDRLPPETVAVTQWHDWEGPEALRACLAQRPARFALRGLPHRRLRRPSLARSLLASEEIEDAAAWRARLAGAAGEPDARAEGLDPAALRALAASAGYRALVRLGLESDPTSFAVLFQPEDAGPATLALPPRQDPEPKGQWIGRPYDAAAQGDLATRARDHLRRTLTPAQIPEHFITLHDWPKSPSQKIIKHKLPLPEVEQRSGPFAAPQGATERQLAGLWCKVLNKAQVGRDDEFFEIGGNSLLLTQLAFSIGKSFGIKFSLNSAFSAPVFSEMAGKVDAIISGEGEAQAGQTAERIASDVKLADAIALRHPEAIPLWPAGAATVFHSGPGGMIAHRILRRLLQEADVKVIYLGAGEDAADSRRIIAEEWTAQGFGRLDLIERIEILPGSLDQPRLGLSQGDWDELAERADVLFHAGIRINMAERYGRLRAANVLGTREMLRLAVHGRLKPLHLSGSFGIVDHSQADRQGLKFDESSELLSFEGLEQDYRKTRWVSESLAQAAAKRGLPVLIHRITPFCGDRTSGLIDPQEITWRVARAMAVTGGFPESRRPLDLLPVDLGVDAMLALARDPAAKPGVNHIIGKGSLLWSDLGLALNALGFAVKQLEPGEWYERLRTWVADHPEDASLGGLLPLLNEDSSDHQNYYEIDGAQTRGRLRALGIDLKSADRADLERTLAFLSREGLLPKPEPKD